MNPSKFFLCVVTASCIAIPALSQGGHGRPAKTYPADVAVAWFELMYDRVKADAVSPVVASRRYAIAGVAFYESIVPGMPGHASLGGQLNQLASFTPPAQGTQFNWPTVANAALGRTLELLFSRAHRRPEFKSLRPDSASRPRERDARGRFVSSWRHPRLRRVCAVAPLPRLVRRDVSSGAHRDFAHAPLRSSRSPRNQISSPRLPQASALSRDAVGAACSEGGRNGTLHTLLQDMGEFAHRTTVTSPARFVAPSSSTAAVSSSSARFQSPCHRSTSA